jgi:pyruvate kinase
MVNIQIVATIGPSCKDRDIIMQMVDAGLSVVRLNFSWGTHQEHGQFVDTVRSIAQEKGMHIPIVQDLSGPRIQEGHNHTFDASASVITEKDKIDLQFTTLKNPEYVAMSFVRTADDVRELRALLDARGSTAKIIAKIERKEALETLDSIIAAADGIMIARGDLGEAIPFETVPFVEKDILKRCLEAGKPCIVATDMLTSMITDATPSRADVTDISQAVLDGASATMLSNETAVGSFPIEAVSVMRKVVDEALKNTSSPSLVQF